MRHSIKEFFQLLIVSMGYWTMVSCLFIIIRYYALNEEGLILDYNSYIPIGQWIDFGVIISVLIGFFYAIIEFLFDKYLLKRLYLGLALIIRTIVYLVLLISALTILMEIAELRFDRELPNEQGWWRTNKMFWINVVYFVIFSLVFSFLKIVKERFGRGTFFKLLVGRYRKPVEEERIIMFLDLKSSISIAEHLGHMKYSKLIQDCFLDLNRVLNRYMAEVYQYVGDEAVLSWDFKQGVKRNNCLRLFYAFQDVIQKRSQYYKEKYGAIPEFKAGLHGGKLIVVEVGSVKKELAYHGDVINTASRIQGKCNDYKENLLISEELLGRLSISGNYQAVEMEHRQLRGKTNDLTIFAVRRSTH